MLLTASKYSPARGPHRPPAPPVQTPGLLVPKFKSMVSWPEWLWREWRAGGLLRTYLERERHEGRRRVRAVARAMHGVRRNLKSDLNLRAAVPLREYLRWRATDPDFFADNANLRSLKRDNPDLPVFV